MANRNFLSELKRRNVYKVAVAYAVVAWLLAQIASQIFPFFEIPNWAVRLVVLLLILGFPVALVLSWAFEITPEGIKCESGITPNESIRKQTGRKIIGLTIVVAIIAGGLLAFQLLRQRALSRLQGGAPAAPELQRLAGARPSIPEKSIAVLPFENLSDDKSNAYFTAGIQDEILTRLAKIADLRVISRSSTQQYASAPHNLGDVAKQLGVANVLEGSVQKIANSVHVNVQLIHAATEQHVWAESYNRTLDDVFAVEGEIASAVAEQLNAKLSGTEQKAVAAKPTQNSAAYDAYLRGAAIVSKGMDTDDAPQAAAEFAQAVQLDPKYAPAWAQLAIIRSFLYFNGLDSPASVKEAVDRAVSLQPDSGEAWLAQAVYRYRVLRDFQSALNAYREAQKRLPNNSDVLEQMAHLERRLGQNDLAEQHYRAASQLDPRNLDILLSLAQLLESTERIKESNAVIDRLLGMSPGNEEALAQKALTFQDAGELTEAAAALNQIPKNSQSLAAAIARAQQLIYERRFEEAIALRDSGAPAAFLNDPRSITMLGYCEEWAGHKQAAEETFNRALAAMKESDGTIPVDARVLPSFAILAYAGLGQKEEAFAEAKRARAAYKDDLSSLLGVESRLAIAQARFGDADSAIATLYRLLKPPGGIPRGDLRLSPFWDPLRGDPRFQKLCEEKPK
jgi:TolB-like protein/Tfp pilus assembly protein PilF